MYKPSCFVGLGYADLENGVRCSPNTVMRIACISKPLSMTAVAKLWEEEKLDIDAPIQKYIPKFPIKIYDGKKVRIPVVSCMLIVSRWS